MYFLRFENYPKFVEASFVLDGDGSNLHFFEATKFALKMALNNCTIFFRSHDSKWTGEAK